MDDFNEMRLVIETTWGIQITDREQECRFKSVSLMNQRDDMVSILAIHDKGTRRLVMAARGQKRVTDIIKLVYEANSITPTARIRAISGCARGSDSIDTTKDLTRLIMLSRSMDYIAKNRDLERVISRMGMDV